MSKIRKQRVATGVLFGVYVLVLTWLILFKGQLSLADFGSYRNVNLIPFGAGAVANGRIIIGEILLNAAVFVPFGLYLCMLRPRWHLSRKVAVVALTSLAFEVLQFALGIGASDITDLLMNTLGGLLGVGLYAALFRLIKCRKTLNRGLNILTGGGSLLLIFFMLFVLRINY